MKSNLLLIDGIINIFIGLSLTVFPVEIIEFLGLPYPENPFYLIMLGSILVGLGVAILIEFFNPELKGLGLCGSVAINICALTVLVISILTGVISLPFKAKIAFGVLIAILVFLSGAKLIIMQINQHSCLNENENKKIPKDHY